MQQEARQILHALVSGVDPASGAQLPRGTVLQQSEVLRALLAAIGALEEQAIRQQRRAQLPPNSGRPWDAAEESALTAAFRAGSSARELAARHGRTLAAIEARLQFLGLMSAAERSTRNRYPERRVRAAPTASQEAPD